MPRRVRKHISLALQGGGALGAYTWGALDRILEDDRLEIAAMSGASAGAMNGVVMCEGLMEGGEEGARSALRRFWEGIARESIASPYRSGPLYAFLHEAAPPWARMAFNPALALAQMWARSLSPYELNPFNLNPVKEVLERLVNFELVRHCDVMEMFVAATNVETGRIRIFTRAELTADHVMASACLPTLFQAVEIEGEHYWDGGYVGNPALFPLFGVQQSRDIFIVQLNPIERPGAPRTADDIRRRINEISFNSSLLAELRAIEFVGRLIDRDVLHDDDHYRKMLIHVLSDDPDLVPLSEAAALNTDIAFFEKLYGIGRMTCDRWLDAHFNDLGRRSTVDLRRMFQGEIGPLSAAPRKRASPR
jgi:NTE family protein